MYPLHKSEKLQGFPSTAEEFSYNPDLEREKARKKEQRHIAKMAKKARKMTKMKLDTVSGKFEEGSLGSMEDGEGSSSDESTSSNKSFYNGVDRHTKSARESYANSAEPTLTLHTNLTTYKSLRDYRNLVQKLLTVYVKLIPTGYIKKFVVDGSDTLYNMYNMYHSHSMYGNAHSSMLLIPTIVGMFELHCQIETETDLLMSLLRGRDKLLHYNLTTRNSSIVMLYIPNYKREYVPVYLRTFFEKNTDFALPHLPMYDTIEHLPDNIIDDVVQKYLRNIITVDYQAQQTELLREYVQRGLDYHKSRDAQIIINMHKHNESAKLVAAERAASKLRMESQLKGLFGEERRAAKKALKARELNKKRSVLYSEEKNKRDTDNMQRALDSRGKSRGSGTSGGGKVSRGVKRSGSGISVNSIGIDDSVDGSGSDSDSDSSTSSGSSGSSGSSCSSGSSTSISSDSSSTSSGSSSDDSITSAKKRKLSQAVPPLPIPTHPTTTTANNTTTAIDVPPVPQSARSTTSTINKFIVEDGPDKESTVYMSHIQKEGLSARSGRSQLSQITSIRSGTSGSYTPRSVTSDGSSVYSRSEYSSQYTNSEYTNSMYDSEYSYTPRSTSTSSTYYTADSYETGSGYSSEYTRSEYSNSEYTSEYSDYTRSNYTGDSRTTDSTYYTDYSTDSRNSVTSKPYHTGSSLHSMYSAVSDPSVRSMSRSVASLYSAIAAAPVIVLDSVHSVSNTSTGSIGGMSTSVSNSVASVGSNSMYTPRSESTYTTDSRSTGGLFTYRSGVSSNYTPRSEDSEGSEQSSAVGTNYSVSQSSVGSGSYSSRYSDSRPSSASSAYSDSTYHSTISGVSEATYDTNNNDSVSRGGSVDKSSVGRGVKQAFNDAASLSTHHTLSTHNTQPTLYSPSVHTAPTLFSNTSHTHYTNTTYTSNTNNTSTSSRTRDSYVSSSGSDTSRSESTYSDYTADSNGSSVYSHSTYNTHISGTNTIDDISLYSSEFRSRDSLGSQDSDDTHSEASFSTQQSLYSDSSHSNTNTHTNTYTNSLANSVTDSSVSNTTLHTTHTNNTDTTSTHITHPPRYKTNQPPLNVGEFAPTDDSLRSRYDKLKKGRELVNQSSVTVDNVRNSVGSGGSVVSVCTLCQCC